MVWLGGGGGCVWFLRLASVCWSACETAVWSWPNLAANTVYRSLLVPLVGGGLQSGRGRRGGGLQSGRGRRGGGLQSGRVRHGGGLQSGRGRCGGLQQHYICGLDIENVNKVVETGVVVNDMFLSVSPHTTPAKQVTVSNIYPPFISDDVLNWQGTGRQFPQSESCRWVVNLCCWNTSFDRQQEVHIKMRKTILCLTCWSPALPPPLCLLKISS